MLVLFTDRDQNLVKSLTEPLPLAEAKNNYSVQVGEAIERYLFVTLRTSSYVPRLNEVDQYWPQSPGSVATSPAPDQNELALALGFYQWHYEIDVAVEHMHACLCQNQGVESIFASSLELFLFKEFPVLFGCSDNFDFQVLIRHRARTLHLDEQIHGDKVCGTC